MSQWLILSICLMMPLFLVRRPPIMLMPSHLVIIQERLPVSVQHVLSISLPSMLQPDFLSVFFQAIHLYFFDRKMSKLKKKYKLGFATEFREVSWKPTCDKTELRQQDVYSPFL